MGRKQSYENAWDVYAMSTYNTITSIAESPVNENILYTGTDDGYIQRTKDGGKTWNKTDVKSFPGVPERAYINDIKADLFDENTVYVALDAHKQGDYTPYLFISKNGGKTWKSITNGIAEKNYVWRIVQDHVNPSLLFIGTEFGIYFTVNGGDNWKQLKGGLPTISFRDLAIQREHNDLVAASFGRSFYILDNYTFLRNLDVSVLEQEAALFQPRETYLYRPQRDGREKGGSQGGQHFYGANPTYGVLFDYYIKEKPKTASQIRKKEEKELNKKEKDVDFPGWGVLAAEKNETSPHYWLQISDSKGNVIRKIKLANSKGVHRTAWNMKASSEWPIGSNSKADGDKDAGWYAAAGKYSARVYQLFRGEAMPMGDAVEVVLKPLHKSTLPAKSQAEKDEFLSAYMAAQLQRRLLSRKFRNCKKETASLLVAAKRMNAPFSDALKQLVAIQNELSVLDTEWSGNSAKNAVGEKVSPTLNDRLSTAGATLWGSNYGPTATAKDGLAIATTLMKDYEQRISTVDATLATIYAALRKAGSPIILEMED
jgi:hypothetical protein